MWKLQLCRHMINQQFMEQMFFYPIQLKKWMSFVRGKSTGQRALYACIGSLDIWECGGNVQACYSGHYCCYGLKIKALRNVECCLLFYLVETTKTTKITKTNARLASLGVTTLCQEYLLLVVLLTQFPNAYYQIVPRVYFNWKTPTTESIHPLKMTISTNIGKHAQMDLIDHRRRECLD